MDEYEELEKDLEQMYCEYNLKFRNQAYLEQLLEEYNKTERDRFEETEHRIREMAEKQQQAKTQTADTLGSGSG